MSFICCVTPSRKRLCTSGRILLMILVFLAFSSVGSSPSKGYQCPNCSGQRIKTVDPSTRKCVDCWPCLECPDGSGSSVPCGATVPVGTKIHCVLCVNGANFSDSPGTDQCQPCGVCVGEHEHVLNKCTPESDVKCDCKAGFYRNRTNDQCLPCSSCPSCLRDKDLFPNCQKDGGKQQMERPSTTTAQSTSLASALVTSSYSHYATSMSLLPGLTITDGLAPTRTQQISTTSTSVVEHERTPTSKPTVQVPPINQNVNINKMNDDHTHESSSKKTEIIISVSLIMCVCLLTGVSMCLLYRTFKNSRTRQLNNDPVRFSELNQGAIEESEQGNNEESNSCEVSSDSVDELNMDKTQCSEIVQERNGSEPDLPSALSGSEDKSNGTADSDHQDGRVIANDHTEHTAAIDAQKGIPSSLEDEQRSCICQVDDVQLHTQSLHAAPLSQAFNVQDGAIADGMEQRRPITWSALSQRQKYNTKVLEMPFPLLYKICLTLDIPRVDGNDVRMLAYKLGISVPGDLAFLRQAAITQPPDNNYFNNSTSYVVLTKKSSLAVRGFVEIMEDIERDDIIHLINNRSN